MPADFMRGAPPARRRLIRERSHGEELFPQDPNRPRNATISYTDDGRRLRDGVPMSPRSPNALWTDFFLRSFVRRLKTNDASEAVDQGDGEGLVPPGETTRKCCSSVRVFMHRLVVQRIPSSNFLRREWSRTRRTLDLSNSRRPI
jgi:hypothetical protein